MVWSIYLTLALLFVPSLSDTEPEKRFLLDTIDHAVNTAGHLLTDTAHSVGNAAWNVVGTLGNATETVVGAAGSLASGLVSTGSNLANGVMQSIFGQCIFFCSHHEQPVHPDIRCPASVSVTSDLRSTSKMVKLANPLFSDPGGRSVKLSVYNLPSGSVFPEGSTSVRFTATNSQGLSSSCLVTVNVTVKRCAKPIASRFENGHVSCLSSGKDMLSGESCNFTCESGYKINGVDTLTCTDANQLSGSMPNCEAVSCGAPPLVPYGQYQCPLGHVFESTCHLACPVGYSPGIRFSITCQSSGKWTLPGQCLSTSPPSFLHTNCTAEVTYTPVSGTSNAKVTWGQVQVDPAKGVGQVTVTQTVGPTPGSVIGPGSQVVVYEAEDRTGNKATCYFTVDASRAVRPCAPPSHSLPDPSLDFRCTNGYDVGSTCTVRCKPGYQWIHQGPAVDYSIVQCSLEPQDQSGFIWIATSQLPVCTSLNTESEKRFLLDTIGHAVNTVGHILTDTAHNIGNTAGNVVGTLGNVVGTLGNTAGTVVGTAGGLVSGLVTTGAELLLLKVDAISTAAVGVLTGIVHGVSDIILGILGHCFFFCSHHHQPVHPDIRCPASVRVTSDLRSTATKVNLANPLFSDPKGGSVKLSVYNLPSGSVFPEGSTSVRFTATNSQGLSSSCLVTVHVTVKRCAKPSYLENGQVSCQSSGKYMLSGESCSFTCEAGYKIHGVDTLTCADANKLSASIPLCEAVSCGAPPLVPYGQYQCPLGHVFESTCHLTCPVGYSPGYKFHITCQSSGKWTLPGQCVSTSPPSFLHTNCSAEVIYTPVSATSNVKVTWGQVQADPTKGVGQVTVTQTVGPTPGSVIGPGSQVVVYEAEDRTGNKATCYFTVDASRAGDPFSDTSRKSSCQIRPCAPPSYSFPDPSLDFRCTNGYTVGSTCTVRCKPGYEMIRHGPAVDYSTVQCSLDPQEQTGVIWMPTSHLPMCKSRKCPPLTPPDNGTLSCDKWVAGNMCQTQCQNGYIFPLSAPANGMYACGNQTGKWRPNNYIFPCVASTLPLAFRASGNMNYSGSCPTSALARAQIRSNFIKTLSTSILMSACTDKTKCNAQNVDVICEKLNGNRQASVKIRFDVVVDYSAANGGGMAAVMAAQGTVNKIASGVATAIKAGQFTYTSSGLTAISGLLHADAMSMDCPTGTAPVYTSGACAGCPKGQYYNVTTSTCHDVPKGYYQPVDNTSTYNPCPNGTSTINTGARNVSECLELCPTGQYSPTGLAPCSLCEKGSYTALPGQVKCSTCRTGHSTMDLAATKADDCMDNQLLYSQCKSSPCFNKGICEDGGPDGYQCRCGEGYTGRQCEIPPSHCTSQPCDNGATCISNNTGYTCVCPLNFKGTHCELQIVNGGWGSWSVWSPCSATCGETGRQSRVRHCDSPAPSNGGTDCQGGGDQTVPCNQKKCPECTTFPKPLNTIIHCDTVGVTHTCNITCLPGYSFTNDPLSSYECGPTTDYKWSFETKTSGFLPSCTEMAAAKRLNVKSTMSFSGLSCSLVGLNSSNRNDLTNEIERHTKKLACIDGGFCTSSTEVKCTAPDKDAVVELTLTASGTDDLDLMDFFQNKQVSPGLAKYLQTLMAMELTGSQLQNHTSSLMSATVNSVTYAAVSKGVTSGAECSSGSVYRGSACVKCSPGTIQVENECHLCEVNTYKPLEGEGQCLKCPQGHITLQTGSSSIRDCILGPKDTTLHYIMVTPNHFTYVYSTD